MFFVIEYTNEFHCPFRVGEFPFDIAARFIWMLNDRSINQFLRARDRESARLHSTACADRVPHSVCKEEVASVCIDDQNERFLVMLAESGSKALLIILIDPACRSLDDNLED